ncbi:hypothetical protein B296_00044041 [Ensete ventricosum]|uniref:Uncharacterized protein n=1 Tax=Ensete ventricosum TaxID=4639 RepID=A0A426ZCC7_ENSVE|nr:hypothetical protein B296_00044041 [Ensete ventricosum]
MKSLITGLRKEGSTGNATDRRHRCGEGAKAGRAEESKRRPRLANHRACIVVPSGQEKGTSSLASLYVLVVVVAVSYERQATHDDPTGGEDVPRRAKRIGLVLGVDAEDFVVRAARTEDEVLGEAMHGAGGEGAHEPGSVRVLVRGNAWVLFEGVRCEEGWSWVMANSSWWCGVSGRPSGGDQEEEGGDSVEAGGGASSLAAGALGTSSWACRKEVAGERRGFICRS